ncbi:hypothetical protein Acsp04_03580 [Actinomadura sp. NBRC 104425]|uniref:DUF6153 family protein n=1 Tax=Actinomadura sp. NBRC 104425 TaxID=3032204 RepID=UPI0024A4B580|nr:DUF6153 family protein [Actinomadura sp. NBRC 104425]GLZ10123.1 hypothetical protein Acsp04_03580 [Actinomadura sp. NBRC 104425]
MRGSGPSPRSVLLTLLGLGLLAGLFMMHGVTASPSPVHVSVPLSVPAAHPPAPAKVHAAGDRHDTAGPVHNAGHLAGCSAGTVCFALLTVALLLVAVAARPVALLPLRAAHGRTAPRRGPPRERPPDIYRLSVLRL